VRSTSDVVDLWRAKVGGGPRKLLDALVAAYPLPLARASLGDRTGFEATGGTFQKYLSTLRSLELVHVDSKGVRAADTLHSVHAAGCRVMTHLTKNAELGHFITTRDFGHAAAVQGRAPGKVRHERIRRRPADRAPMRPLPSDIREALELNRRAEAQNSISGRSIDAMCQQYGTFAVAVELEATLTI